MKQNSKLALSLIFYHYDKINLSLTVIKQYSIHELKFKNR